MDVGTKSHVTITSVSINMKSNTILRKHAEGKQEMGGNLGPYPLVY